MTRTQHERLVLLTIWFGGFALSLGSILALYALGWIHASNLRLAAAQINELYAPYLGAITLFYWGSRHQGLEADAVAGRVPFALAAVLSGAWNILLLVFLAPPVLGSGAIEDTLDNLHGVVGLFSWLAAGAIGYYFGRPAALKEAV